jgi:hypothetical protein
MVRRRIFRRERLFVDGKEQGVSSLVYAKVGDQSDHRPPDNYRIFIGGIIMKKISLALLLLAVASTSYATDVCVGPTFSGNGSGSDWNNIAQWSSLSFTRGNSYYLQDGTYGAKTLSTAVSGSTYIYIKKATESAHGSATGWSSTYGDGIATFTNTSDVLTISTSYWDIDGVTGGGPGSWTSGHGIAFTSAASATTIGYINIAAGLSNIYVRHISFIQTGDTTAYDALTSAIYAPGVMNNSVFEYNYMNNIGGLPFLLRDGSGNIIQYNYTGVICGAYVHSVGNHCETIVIRNMNDLHLRWNYFGQCPSSGGFVHNGDTGVTSDSIRIYGNVFTIGTPMASNGGNERNWRIFNNTFHTYTAGPFSYGGDYDNTNYMYNNILYGTNETHRIAPMTDYNWYSNATIASYEMLPGAHENITDYPGHAAETLNPFVNYGGTTPEDYRLTAAIAGWPGLNVCTLDACTGEKKYNIDAFGNTRGADGVWDRGAYEYRIRKPLPPSAIVVY